MERGSGRETWADGGIESKEVDGFSGKPDEETDLMEISQKEQTSLETKLEKQTRFIRLHGSFHFCKFKNRKYVFEETALM